MRFRLVESLLMEDLVDVKKYYPNISQEDFDRIIALDPTFNREQDKLGTYGKWILSLFNKGKLTDEGHVFDLLTRFESEKNNLKNKDIGHFNSIEEVDDYLDDESNYKSLSNRQKLRKTQKAVRQSNLKDDADLLFSNNNWEVWVPHTYEASCKLGRGASWCTATTENDYYYKQYTNEGKLYININKKDPSEKYQFHFETRSYMDSDDEPINIVDFFIENVDLFNFYKTIIGDDALYKKWKIIPTVSFLIENSSDTFIYSKDNAKSFKKYSVWLRRRTLKHLIIDKSVSVIPASAFYNFTELQTVEIQDGVTSIGDGVFSDCYSLSSITIPDSVTSIGSWAFNGCSSLTNVTIPDGVTSIGSYAFSNCRSLKSVTIPDSVTSIGDRAFYSCDSLKSITIPDSVRSIGKYAFHYCKNLKKVYYDGTKEQWNSISISDENESLFNADIIF